MWRRERVLGEGGSDDGVQTRGRIGFPPRRTGHCVPRSPPCNWRFVWSHGYLTCIYSIVLDVRQERCTKPSMKCEAGNVAALTPMDLAYAVHLGSAVQHHCTLTAHRPPPHALIDRVSYSRSAGVYNLVWGKRSWGHELRKVHGTDPGHTSRRPSRQCQQSGVGLSYPLRENLAAADREGRVHWS